MQTKNYTLSKKTAKRPYSLVKPLPYWFFLLKLTLNKNIFRNWVKFEFTKQKEKSYLQVTKHVSLV